MTKRVDRDLDMVVLQRKLRAAIARTDKAIEGVAQSVAVLATQLGWTGALLELRRRDRKHSRVTPRKGTR